MKAYRPDEWVLAIVGWDQDGHEKTLKQYVAEKQMENSVFFCGPQFNDDKIACYQNADGFILPSLSEGLPMVLLEAWSYKLPVLMTPECNLPEGFETGAAVEIRSEARVLEQQLRDFFSLSTEEKTVMGQRGYEHVARIFKWDRVAEDLHEVYRWILGCGAPPNCIVRG